MVNKLNIVIPMAGIGQRFQDAGYTIPKALIPILGKPMVQYVLDAFPEYVARHLIITKDTFNDEQLKFFRTVLKCNLIFIDSHKLGPAYSFHMAGDSLPLEESIFVSYCDIFWTWDFDEVTASLDQDGIIYTHQNFHPHLVNNNFSAFCRPLDDDKNSLAEIKEKQSFTDQWMEEPLSVGIFYARRGHDLADAIEDIIIQDNRTANEFFPSVAFNKFITDGKSVGLQNVDFFIHWGLPEQLNDFFRWKSIYDAVETKHNLDNIMCMAGSGSRMKEISNVPKPFLNIRGKAMYDFVASQFSSHTELITSPEITKLLGLHYSMYPVLTLPYQTPDQLTTLREASSYLSQKKNFFLSSCDAYGCFNEQDFIEFLNEKTPDAVIFTFKPSLMQAKLSQHHTHVSVSGDYVTEIHIKSKSSNDDLGLGGFFWIRDGNYFSELDNISIDKHELCADHAFREFVKQGLKILHYQVDHYIHLGTPEEYLEYQFWMNHFDNLKLE